MRAPSATDAVKKMRCRAMKLASILGSCFAMSLNLPRVREPVPAPFEQRQVCKAAEQGDERSGASQMTSDEIAEEQRLAREWKPK